jgi:peroxiredoxin
MKRRLPVMFGEQPQRRESDMKQERGNKAPDFMLEDQNGKMTSLSDYASKKVLIFFYPKAGTSG